MSEPRALDMELLQVLDRYLDTAPRTAARPESIGPFTLFVNHGPGWSYYARPTRGVAEVSPQDVRRVLGRQRRMGIPRTFEWVAELVPSMAAAAEEAGLIVERHPLMHLPKGLFVPASAPRHEIRLITANDDVAAIRAVGAVAFGSPGTEGGSLGPSSPASTVDAPAETAAFIRRRMERGRTVTAAAFAEGRPVAIGSHQPVGSATEIVGVGTVPGFRRRGLASAITSMLVQDAMARGIETIFLSAGDAAIARIHTRLGFTTVGTAGAAEEPDVGATS